jgi:hypothetical protein
MHDRLTFYVRCKPHAAMVAQLRRRNDPVVVDLERDCVLMDLQARRSKGGSTALEV